MKKSRYDEFVEVFGHPLWVLPMCGIVMFVFIETIHLRQHVVQEGDAHGYCGQKEWVKDLIQYKEDNMY